MKATLPAKDTTTADSIKATWPKDTLVAKLKESFTFCESAFAQLDDAKLAENVTMSFRGQSRSTPRATMVLGHALDMADHYSQIANYMRLNNILPPTALPARRAGRLAEALRTPNGSLPPIPDGRRKEMEPRSHGVTGSTARSP